VRRFVPVLVSVVFGLSLLGEVNLSRGEFGEFLKVFEFMRGRPVDAGGITFIPDDPGHFYESWRKTSKIWRRRVSDGAVVEEIPVNWPAHPSTGVHGMSWDPSRRVFWISNAYHSPTITTLPRSGGSPSGEFNLRNCAGVDYYAPADELWVIDALRHDVYRYSPPGTRIDRFTMDDPYPDPHPIGIARVKDRLWISNWYETGERGGTPNYVSEYFLNGTPTGRRIEITNRTAHGVTFTDRAAFLDLAFDGQYLWALTCNPCKVVQVDIGYKTPTPPPTPTPLATPTPIYMVFDSGDYSGDGTSDLAVFRPASGLWAVRGVTRVFFGRTGDIPAPGDYRGDGTSDLAVFRPASGLWAVRGLTRVTFGRSGDIPVPGDYSGDGTCDIGVFRPGNQLWAIRGLTRVNFGARGDRPVPGYYTGSRSKDIAVFHPGTASWAIRGLTRIRFGRPGDDPVPGDYAGVGRDEIAVYRPGSRLWAVRGLTRTYFGPGRSGQPQPADYRGDGISEPADFNGASALWRLRGSTRIYFGHRGDIPVAGPPPRPGLRRMPVIDSGDYSGDGTSEIAVFRDQAGFWAIRGLTRIYFGSKGDIPVSGDYRGDGTAEIAVYRPRSGLWSIRGLSAFHFGGGAGDLPVPGDYNGDGTCDWAVFDHRTGRWRVRIEIPFSSRGDARKLFGEGVEVSGPGEEAASSESKAASTAPFTYEFTYGKAGDLPVPGHYTGGPRKLVAVFRPATALWAIRGVSKFTFGRPGDIPVPGDFTGDGTAEAAIYRPSNRLWAVRGVTKFFYGREGDLPVPAGYAGDGTSAPAVFRARSGYWAARGVTRVYFGRPGDTPAVGGAAGSPAR